MKYTKIMIMMTGFWWWLVLKASVFSLSEDGKEKHTRSKVNWELVLHVNQCLLDGNSIKTGKSTQ